jgi:hypothetical protein
MPPTVAPTRSDRVKTPPPPEPIVAAVATVLARKREEGDRGLRGDPVRGLKAVP